MKKIFTLVLVCICAYAYPQKIVFSQDVKSDTVRPTKGPNLKNYTHVFLGFGFPLFTGEALNYTKPGASMIVDYGIRYKRRLNNTFALGFDLSVNWAAFKIKQDDGKSIPDSTINKKEKFQVNSLSPDIYIRINAGRRGNYIGKFLDLGAFGSWNWEKAHKTQNKNAAGELVKTTTLRLTYVEDFSYGVLARIGMNRFALAVKYRLSNLFTKSSGFAEVPRFSAGLEIGLFK